MRFCGTFCGILDFERAKNRAQPHRVAGQSIGSALLTVHDADRRAHRQGGFAERGDGVEERSSGGDDILYEANALSFLVDPLQPIGGAVLLGIAGGMLAGAAFLRRQAAQRDRADLYFEDGSMLSLTNGSPGAERLLPLAREILGKARGT